MKIRARARVGIGTLMLGVVLVAVLYSAAAGKTSSKLARQASPGATFALLRAPAAR